MTSRTWRTSIVVLTLSSMSLVAPEAAAAPPPTCQGVTATIVGKDHIVGTDGDDVIVGSDQDDYIDAGEGNDLVCGLDGHDVILDGPGRDRIYGGDGQDGVWQSTVDRDVFDGGPGFDAVMYVERTEDMYVNLRDRKANDGQAGERDRLLSVASVTSGSGDDVLIAGTEVNTGMGGGFPGDRQYYLLGGSGNDVLIGGPLGDLIAGGLGSDVMKGRGGLDYLRSAETWESPGVTSPPEPDRVDGGAGRPMDYAECDELDTITRVGERQGC